MRSLLMLLAVTACSGDDAVHHLADAPPAAPDAPPADAAPDAAPDAPPTTVTVRLASRAAGQLVEWYDAAGAVVADNATDATGAATAAVPAGGAVTVAIAATKTLYTTLGVVPGDVVVIAAPPDPTIVGTITVTGNVPGVASYASADQGDASDPIAVASTANALSLHAGAVSAAGTYDLVALAYDVDEATVAYAVDVGIVAPPPGGEAAHAMSAFATDVAHTALTATNTPAGAFAMMFGENVDLGAHEFGLRGHQSTIAGGGASFTVGVPNHAFDHYIHAAAAATASGYTEMIVATTARQATVAFDFAQALPTIHGATASTDGDTYGVSATIDGPTTGAVGAIAHSAYDDVNHYVAGPAGSSLVAPALGDALGAVYFRDAAGTNPTFMLVGGTGLWADAAAFRAHPFDLVASARTPAVGKVDGTVLASFGTSN